MSKQLFLLLFLAVVACCHATSHGEKDGEPQKKITGESEEVSETDDENGLSRMIAGEGMPFEKAGELGEYVERDEAALGNMSDQAVDGENDSEEAYGNALDVIKTNRQQPCRLGGRRCTVSSFCCPRGTNACCRRDCCARRFNRCSRLSGTCVTRGGIGPCRNVDGSNALGRPCSDRVCCKVRSIFNVCSRVRISPVLVLARCITRQGFIPCGRPARPGVSCGGGKCCQNPLRCCRFNRCCRR